MLYRELEPRGHGTSNAASILEAGWGTLTWEEQAHLLQVGVGDGFAGQHLVWLAGERRQRRQLLPMGQAAAQHGQPGADRSGEQAVRLQSILPSQPSPAQPSLSISGQRSGREHLC